MLTQWFETSPRRASCNAFGSLRCQTVGQSLLDSQYLLHQGKLRNKRERERESDLTYRHSVEKLSDHLMQRNWRPERGPSVFSSGPRKVEGQFLSYPHPFCREKEAPCLYLILFDKFLVLLRTLFSSSSSKMFQQQQQLQ